MPQSKRPVLLCGENPGMTLYDLSSDQPLVILSYWHCTYSIAGAGHTLVVWLNPALTTSDQQRYSGIFSDNLPLAKLVVTALTQHFPEFKTASISTLPYIASHCQHNSDGRVGYTVSCTGDERTIKAR